MSGSALMGTAKVLENRALNAEIRLLVLSVEPNWPKPVPGQFVQIECLPDSPFALRRPFSVARVKSFSDRLEIHLVFGPIGMGTDALASRRLGDTVGLIGPLGSGFRPLPGRRPILVGGGRGVAPLLGLADSLEGQFDDPILLFGVRSADQLYELEGVPCPIQIATQDGSSGFSGNVIELLEQMSTQGTIRSEDCAIYSCGPNPMLHALSDWAVSRGYPCQVSLETLFGCGFGICAGCAIPVHPVPGEEADEFGHYRFACVEGPVFDGERVDWEGVVE